MPALAAVALIPKAADVVKSLGGKLGLGETATDKSRKQTASSLEGAALSGDRAAVKQLEFNAFDQRGRSPDDNRQPRDGQFSPAAVRELAVKALKRVVAAGVPLSSAQRYSQLKVPIPTTGTQDIVRAVVTPIAERFAPDVGSAVADVARPTINRAVIVGVVVAVIAVIGVVMLTRGGRG